MSLRPTNHISIFWVSVCLMPLLECSHRPTLGDDSFAAEQVGQSVGATAGGGIADVPRRPLKQWEVAAWEHVLRSPKSRALGLVEFSVRDTISGEVEDVCAVADMALLLIMQELHLKGDNGAALGLEALRRRTSRIIEVPGGLPREFRAWLPPAAERSAAKEYVQKFSNRQILIHERDIYLASQCVNAVQLIACGCEISHRGFLVSLRQEPGGLVIERYGK